ncbi:MAG TPA: DEAD/DEAH box helicase [Saprospiraceae bacterium]|nr:DEAD/DEAH box helicase [Saprospiraceae bacterium]HMQ82743.1 DEAD/DEAH box helicase [Saprospiraceae bacterium]
MQLSVKSNEPETLEVVYNLYAYEADFYLPAAFIVTVGLDGELAHIKQRATIDTLKGQHMPITEEREKLLDLIEQLQPKSLEDKYNPPKKKALSLRQLLQDEQISPSIKNFTHRLLHELLIEIEKNGLPLTWEVERRVLVQQFLIPLQKLPLEPHLYFKKEKDNIRYRLQLGQEDKIWNISSKEVVPVTNHPAWLYVDGELVQAAYINGNMVKPFQEKDEVLIPQKSIKAYFQKFILKVAAKADIEVEGFELKQFTNIIAATLQPNPHLFENKWLLSLLFQYPETEVAWSDKKHKITKLEFGPNEEINILQILRDEAGEKTWVALLEKKLGLKPYPDSALFFRDDLNYDNPKAILEWLAQNRLKLEKLGLKVSTPVVEEKNLYLFPSRIQLSSEQQNDWFDLYGYVTVGDYQFPFVSLAKNIKENDPYYLLPNGEYFLIPQEWLNKYQSLVQFGKKEKDHLRLTKSQFMLLDELALSPENNGATEPASLENFEISPLLKADLRPYQYEGVKWLVQLYEKELGACLADDMGLGKTLQTIATLLHAKEKKANPENSIEKPAQQLNLFDTTQEDITFLKPLQALIVLPASLVFNWQSEISRFAPNLQVYNHTGPKRYKDIRLLQRFDVILTTYQTALRDIDLLNKLEYEYIVLDESQQIKNKDSQLFRAVNELNARHKISLSGTPIENSLSDLWAQMQFINPDLLGSFNFFKRHFITPIEKRQDDLKKAELRKIVQPYLLRRTKEEVARDLPELTTKLFYSEMTPEQKRLYESEKSAARNYLLENFLADNAQYRLQVLQSLTKLRQLANHPKLAKTQYEKSSGKFQDIVEHWNVIHKGGHKVLFFSSFVKHLELYRQHFHEENTSFSWLTGDMTGKAREKAIRQFQEQSDIQAFLISIKSGGAGLNLTAANYVFILDPWWNPTTERQAIARAHRIGQDKPVIAIKFITKGSIEEKILLLQERKSQLAEDILSSNEHIHFNKSDIEYLFD